MDDFYSYFSKTLDYLEGLLKKNQLDNEFAIELNEQKENLDNFKLLIFQYQNDLLLLDSYEAIESDETLDKLMIIHKFMTDLEWHISEISDLKDKIIKTCTSKRM